MSRPHKENHENFGRKTMNIFEDLIEELKEENLLEETVIETGRLNRNKIANSEKVVKIEDGNKKQTPKVSPLEALETAETEEQTSLINEAEFYRKRAMDEVAFLQIVEHVFAGVEREQLKIVPKPYDDLKVKKVLHNLLQLAPDVDPMERSKAESQLMQETESWHWSLAQRDERLTAAHLRRYCETSRPALSSPALVALARFYRNSPYSEPVRNKFDLVVTRLFTKENGKSQRDLIFSRAELIRHLKELYAEWSSVPMYSTEPGDAELAKIVSRFESFMREADNAIRFDDLIQSNFFARLHSFKRNTNENFYAPIVTATGIESNIRIGNRYVELLEFEKKLGNIADLEDKYGLVHDISISEATGKTFSLIELLKEKKPSAPPVENKIDRQREIVNEIVEPPVLEQVAIVGESSKAHKWIIAATALIVILFLGIYFTGSNSGTVEIQEEVAKPKLIIENSILSEYLEEAALENGTLKGVVLPVWSQLLDDQKKDILKQMQRLGGQKGYDKVLLVNKAGKSVASAAEGSIQLLE